MGETRRKVVLIVEDDYLLIEEIADAFRRNGWLVFDETHAESAISLLATGVVFDALVTDIQLAGKLTGWDVAEVARTRNKTAPIVYVSGSPADEKRRLPHTVFVGKPYVCQTVVDFCSPANAP